jgi:hypothetical protein
LPILPIVPIVPIVFAVLLSGCSDNAVSYGAAPSYRTIPESDGDRETNPNCYAYALGIYDKSYNPGDFSKTSYIPTVESVADAVEKDMNVLNRGCRRIASFNSSINNNEYRIALRVSTPKYIYYNNYVYIDWDYHFMVQTSTGGWADKHGPGGCTIYYENGNPSTISWNHGTKIGYYDSEIIYFAITP